ncbi:zinc finger-domain protein [Perkinsela sp. CCAP 1560/4]|nr:zinc finger-domain protein [Perkinsela sp. CCAP 1560/4]|eukprot:KNH07942.1 zinc finger-domain protein [Perkinsela sp. CCAP 1560/4]
MEAESGTDCSTILQPQNWHRANLRAEDENLLTPFLGHQWKEPPFAAALAPEAAQKDAPSEQDKPRASGTDLTKYKTAICRNWETTGTCSFRGCTFAHGREELRPLRPPGLGEHPPAPRLTEHKPSKLEAPFPYNHSFLPKERKEQAWSHVDQALHELYDAIRKERANYSEQTQGNYALGIMLRREQMYKVQREKDQQDIVDLQERVQHLERIIVQLHIEHSNFEIGAEKNNLTKKEENSIKLPPLSHEALLGSADTSTLRTTSVDGQNQSLMLLSLLKSTSRIPAGL